MLSSRAKSVITACCPPESTEEVARLISENAGSNLPGVGSGANWATLIERIQLAIIRGSNWQISQIELLISIAKTDFRDLLVQQGFSGLTEHIEWHEKAIKSCNIA